MSRRAKCPLCGKELPESVVNLKNYVYRLRGKNGKLVGLCSWACYKKCKANMILKKDIITEEEANWLKYARVPIPDSIQVKEAWFMRYKYY